MPKLNQNYLDVIRDNLYNKKKVKKVKSHSKNDKVSLQEKHPLSSISEKAIIKKKCEKIKIKKPELKRVESLKIEKLPKKNSVKRKLSISPNLPIKKVLKKKKLIIISPSKDSSHKSKINNKGYNFGPYLNGYKEFSKKKSSEKIEEKTLPIGHFYDDDPNLNVKNLMIKNFFKLFKTRVFDNEHLHVPRKFFKFSENDLVDEIIIHHQKESIEHEEINSKQLNEVNDLTVVEEEEEVEADKKSEEIVDQLIINTDEEDEADVNEENETDKESEDNNITEKNLKDEVPNTDYGTLSILDLENGNKILILDQMDQKIYFNGLCYVEVLYGEIEILGAILNKSSKKSYKVYSPRGTSLIYIKNNVKLYSEDKIDLNNIIISQPNCGEFLKIPSYSSVVLLKTLEEFYIRFIEDNIMHKIFPYNNFDNTIRVDFELSNGQFNKIQCTNSWKEILNETINDSKSIFMICGGKNVGKSTFLRYSVNSMLGKFKEICVLDLDPGQSEFSSPGFLSLSKIGEFLLGPNYTHLKSPEIMVLTNINVGFNAEKYLNNVKYLLKYWNENSLNNTPLLINSPGFTQGLGSNIIIDVIKETRPTTILEIISKIPTKNYNFDLTEINEELNYEYCKFNSLSENNEAWSLEARQFREISILSYFGKMMNQNINNLTDFNIDMLSINISSLKIINNEGKSLNPWAINGNLVALCSICSENDFDILIGYGYGLVRGMDLEQDILILITPESVETLQKNVTHLVISPTILPPTILMGAQNVHGHVPYINTGDLIDFGQLTKRSYIPPKEKLINIL